jgi:hypothetical protein
VVGNGTRDVHRNRIENMVEYWILALQILLVLLVQRRTGYYLALFATIRFRPEKRDWELILKLDPGRLPPGFIYYKLIEAVEALKAANVLTPDQLKQLHNWLDTCRMSGNTARLASTLS